jgi:hypothetical protein
MPRARRSGLPDPIAQCSIVPVILAPFPRPAAVMISDVPAPVDISSLPELVETKLTLDGRTKVFRCRALDRTAGAAVVLFVADRAYRVADLDLPAGTVTFGYFWADRPYNVYHWMRSDGGTLAHYFNLASDTRLEEGRLTWRDLTVDVLLRPGRPPEVLDEAELPDPLDQALAALIGEARARTLADAGAVAAALEAQSTRLWQRLFGRARP